MSGFNEPRRDPPWQPPAPCKLCGLDLMDNQSRVTWFEGGKVVWTVHRACRDRRDAESDMDVPK